jgi:hypothetical protein
MLPFSIFFQFFGFNSPTSIIIIMLMMVAPGGVTTGFYFLQMESVASAAIYCCFGGETGFFQRGGAFSQTFRGLFDVSC